MTEYIFIGVIVAAAALMLFLRIRKGLSGPTGSCCGQSGCCGADEKPEKESDHACCQGGCDGACHDEKKP